MRRTEGGVLVHAHPFRGAGTMMDYRLLDGVEINCHPLYDDTHSRALLDMARAHSLIVTCGGDYHADTYRPRCGVYLPDDIADSLALGRCLAETKEIALWVHEIGAGEPVDIRFQKAEE